MSKTEIPKISAPALRALDSVRVKYLEDLTRFTAKEIQNLHGMGPKALDILKLALEEKNLSFAAE